MYTIDRGFDEVTKKHRGIIYHVNEEKRTVVARLIDCKNDVIEQIVNATRSFDEYDPEGFWSGASNKFKMPNEFIGIAKCDPRDAFNVEKGKEIAKVRCLMKYHDSKLRTIAKALNRIDEISTIINDIYETQCKITDEKWDALMEVNPVINN